MYLKINIGNLRLLCCYGAYMKDEPDNNNDKTWNCCV